MMRITAVLVLVLLCCAPSARASAAPQDAVASRHKSFSIGGVVIDASSGAAVSRCELTLLMSDDQGSVIGTAVTDAHGVFRFDGVAQGTYRLEASRRGYIASAYQEHSGFATGIVTGPDLDTTHLRFPLTAFGTIDGTISDDNGDPVEDAQVHLFRQDQMGGEGRIVRAGQEMSDDRGTFEFAHLRPGSYFLCVSATPWYAFRPTVQTDNNGNPLPEDQQPTSPLDVAYPLTFYPNASDAAGATPIPVRGGDHLQISFSLHAVPAIHIRVRVPVASGGGMIGAGLMADAFGTPVEVGTPRADFRPREQMALYDISGLAPGKYELREGQARVTQVDATASHAVDAPAAASNVEITGKIGMAAGGDLPNDLTVIARRDEDRTVARAARVSKDGSFTLQGVPPGTYDVTVRGANNTLVIAQMAASGAEVHGNRVTVGPDPVLLAATLDKGSAIINGFVRRGGHSVEGAMVELIPDDPNAPTDLLRRDQSNTDGSFTLRRVVPGHYTLVAIEDGWTLEWARRDAMASYLARGMKIEVGANQTTVDLPNAVEVQPR